MLRHVARNGNLTSLDSADDACIIHLAQAHQPEPRVDGDQHVVVVWQLCLLDTPQALRFAAPTADLQAAEQLELKPSRIRTEGPNMAATGHLKIQL